MDMRNDPEMIPEPEFFAVIRDEKIYGFCSTRARALEVLNELCDKDLENAPTNKVHRRVYDDINMTMKVYSQSWTLAIFPFEQIEHYYFVSPIKI